MKVGKSIIKKFDVMFWAKINIHEKIKYIVYNLNLYINHIEKCPKNDGYQKLNEKVQIWCIKSYK